MKKYRVIIWGLGNVGRIPVRMCVQKKSLELVGVIDIAPDKVGRDAGGIFGFGRAGVIVQDNVAEVFSRDADVMMCCLPSVMSKGPWNPVRKSLSTAAFCR